MPAVYRCLNSSCSESVTALCETCQTWLPGLKLACDPLRSSHITPVLADLHWLPVRFRIEYTIALITFKALSMPQPQYLAELIRYYEAPRQLRSRGENILQNSASVLNFSKCAFCHASPTVWNSLPHTVISDLTVTTATLKNRLKSALYGRAFLQ